MIIVRHDDLFPNKLMSIIDVLSRNVLFIFKIFIKILVQILRT